MSMDTTQVSHYVMDTSVLVFDPQSLYNFADVIVPFEVILELDKLKTLAGEVGQKARIVIRELEKLTLDWNGKEIETGKNKIVLMKLENLGEIKNDQKILKYLKDDCILVSRDINLRLQARILGFRAESYENKSENNLGTYLGYQETKDYELGEKLKKDEFVICPDEYKLEENEFLYCVDKNNGGVIGRKIGNELRIVKNRKPWGLELKGKEQLMAADLICDPRVPLVSLMGFAGTAKTCTALACALDLVLEKKVYQKLIIYRPVEPMGRDIGWLPGTVQDKLAPYMQPIYDNLEFLFNKGTSKKSSNLMENLSVQYAEKIEINALTYIRGRSIPRALLIVDEAQNLSKEEMKTILTRVGIGSKLILTHDDSQVDRKELDAGNNGPMYVVEKFKSSSLAGHVTLTKGLRSELATLAANIL